MGKARDTTQAVWRDRLQRWRESKVSDEEFAAIEGVKPSALKWWQWRLKGAERHSTNKVAPPFVEVTTTSAMAPLGRSVASLYEVVLSNGRVVRVSSGFQEGEVAVLLALADKGAR